MSRQQRNINAFRTHTVQVRAVLMNGPNYKQTEFVPVVKVAYGHAEPCR